MEKWVDFGEFRFDTPQYAEVRFIEWEKVFLIAGMLPLRAALDKSGTAPSIGRRC